MSSPAGAILLVLLIGCIMVIAMFLRLLWEDGEAVEISIDEIEEPDAFAPVNKQQETGDKRSIQS